MQPKKDKEIKDGEIKKKYWRIDSKEGTKMEFFPVFEVNKESGEVECRYVEIRTRDNETDQPKIMTLDWLNLYMFVYFCCNEQMRQGLAMRYEKKVNYIPYDVQIKVTPEEARDGFLKRRIELPVDELTMAIARNEAYMMMNKMLKNGGKLKPENFRFDKNKGRPV